MTDENLKAEIDKLKFHVSLLGEGLYREKPTASLVIQMDWSEDDLNDAHDIFEEAFNLLDQGKEPVFEHFEKKLKDRFKINYQGIKPIVLAFYENDQWIDVCEWYVMAHTSVPSEFSRIAENINNHKSNDK